MTWCCVNGSWFREIMIFYKNNSSQTWAWTDFVQSRKHLNHFINTRSPVVVSIFLETWSSFQDWVSQIGSRKLFEIFRFGLSWVPSELLLKCLLLLFLWRFLLSENDCLFGNFSLLAIVNFHLVVDFLHKGDLYFHRCLFKDVLCFFVKIFFVKGESSAFGLHFIFIYLVISILNDFAIPPIPYFLNERYFIKGKLK